MILGSALGLGKAVAGYFGRKAEARDARKRLDSERRQRVKRNSESIQNSSSSGAGAVESGTVDTSLLERTDQPEGDFVKDPSFFGSIISGFGGAFKNFFGGR